MMNNELATIMIKFVDYENESTSGLRTQAVKLATPESEEQMYYFIAQAISDSFDSKFYSTSITLDKKFITEEVFNKVNDCLLKISNLKLVDVISSCFSGYVPYHRHYSAQIIDFNTMKYHDISTGKNPIHCNMIKIDGTKVQYDLKEPITLSVPKSRTPQLINYPYKSMFGNDIGRFSLIRNEPGIITEDTWMCEHCGIIYKLSDNEKHIGQILECKNCRKNTIIIDEDEYLVQGINPIESNRELWKTDNIFMVTGDESKDLSKALEEIKEDKWKRVSNLPFLLYNISKHKKYHIFKLECDTNAAPIIVKQIEDYMKRNHESIISVSWLNANIIIFV